MTASAAQDSRPATAVVHHHSGIGDLICHVPYIRAVAAQSRGGRVTVIARPSCKAPDLLSAETCVERVIEFDRKPRKIERRSGRHDGMGSQLAFARQLRELGIQRIFIFSGRTRYAVLALLAGIRERAGYGFSAGQRLFLNRPPHIRRHEGPGNWVYPEATQFAIAHGLADGPLPPRLAVPAAVVEEMEGQLRHLPRPRYAFAIGASLASKLWPEERFAALAEALAAEGAGVVLLGGPAEADSGHRIIGRVPPGLRASIHMLAQPSIMVTAGALRNCDYCVGNDTGALNLAVACDRPSLGLFGATPPALEDPLLHGVRGDGMAAITVGMVLEKLQALLPGRG